MPPLMICFLAPSYSSAHTDLSEKLGDRLIGEGIDRGLIKMEDGTKAPFRIFIPESAERNMRGHRFSEVVPLPGWTDEGLHRIAEMMIRPLK